MVEHASREIAPAPGTARLNRSALRAGLILLLANLAACGATPIPSAPLREQLAEPETRPTDPAPSLQSPDDGATARNFFASGLASWYGAEHQGKRTASGERFDRHGLTAAHPTLPLGSCVTIFNPQNRKSAIVRVNDRGPAFGGRIIDLSQAAAEAIGMRRQGIATVLLLACDQPILAAAR